MSSDRRTTYGRTTARTDRLARLARIVAAVAFAGAIGCGSDPPGVPAAVSGMVALDGKPVAAAQAVFTPAAGTPGRRVVLAVRDGYVQADEAGGLFAGRYGVRVVPEPPAEDAIQAAALAGRAAAVGAAGIPRRYQTGEPFAVELAAGPNDSLTFFLESRPGGPTRTAR